MGKKRCDIPFLPIDTIDKILVWLPVVSLLRFKLVCKSWYYLIQTLINLHTTSKFGSFILHAAAVDFEERFREDAVFMLSSSSSSSSCVNESECCGRCDSRSANSGIRVVCGKDCCENRKWSPPVTSKYYYLGGAPPPSSDDPQQQQLVLKLDNLGFPSCYQFDRIKPSMGMVVVGSCNGLICLYAQQPNHLQVSLWNPVTRQFRTLPKPRTYTTTGNNGDGGDVHRLFAFGYDAETKDYKVVILSVYNRRMLNYVIGVPVAMECVCRVQVYSLSTNSWRLLKGITSLPGSPSPYPPDSSSSSSELFYLNGCCFFMAELLYSSEENWPPRSPDMHERFIISLDLTQEIITPIQLPIHHPLEHLYLCYLGKKIALFAKTTFVYTSVYDVNDPKCSREDFCISVFNEHRSNWTEIHSFEIRLGLPGERNIPRGISNDGVFALLETEIRDGGGLGNKKKKKKMKLYNLVTNEVKKKNFLSCDQVLSKAYAYYPSLVSIIGEAAAAAATTDDMVIGKAEATEMDGNEVSSSRISQPMPMIIE